MKTDEEIKAIALKEHPDTDNKGRVHLTVKFFRKKLREALFDGYKLAQEDKWVSVKDRFPEEIFVLVSYKFGVREAKFVDGKFGLPHNWQIEFPEVTHWQPLPSKAKQ